MKQLIDRYPTKQTRLFVRLSPDERQWVVEAAKEADMTISDLVRFGLNQVLPMIEPNNTKPRNIEQYHATYYSTIKEFGRTYKRHRGTNGRNTTNHRSIKELSAKDKAGKWVISEHGAAETTNRGYQ